MGIDESGGMKYRKDSVVKSASQSVALACLTSGPVVRSFTGIRRATFGALERRGWAVERDHPEVSKFARAWHLTDAGRAVAEASPAVRAWLDGWAEQRKRKLDRA
jgi:hypothetical protein